jgi:hypothetical protein
MSILKTLIECIEEASVKKRVLEPGRGCFGVAPSPSTTTITFVDPEKLVEALKEKLGTTLWG